MPEIGLLETVPFGQLVTRGWVAKSRIGFVVAAGSGMNVMMRVGVPMRSFLVWKRALIG